MAKPPTKRRTSKTATGKPGQKPSSVAEKAEDEIGDSAVLVRLMAHEMLVAADILNRLRLAEEAQTGDPQLGSTTTSRIEKQICDDVQDALLLPSEMAELPSVFVSEQRALWEDEVARYALALNTPAIRGRLDANAQRWTALRMLKEADSQHIKRTATYANIADHLGIKGTYSERQVRRILNENAKAQGGAANVSRRLLKRDLVPIESLPEEVNLIPPDEKLEEIVRSAGRKRRPNSP